MATNIIGIGIANAIGFKSKVLGEGNIKYPHLIAAYSAKGKSNSDEDKNILKDLTGNGHDITLHNFAFSGMSGYGGFHRMFKYNYYEPNYKQYTINDSWTKISFNIETDIDIRVVKRREAFIWDKHRINVKGLVTEDDYINIYGYFNSSYISKITISNNGIHEVPASTTEETDIGGYVGFIEAHVGSPSFIEIEIIPEYPDTLVFDGVDDYGTNETFPVLQDGFTVIYKRVILSSKEAPTLHYTNSSNSHKVFVCDEWLDNAYWSYGAKTVIPSSVYDNVSNIQWGTPSLYNRYKVVRGTNPVDDCNIFNIGMSVSKHAYKHIAFYCAYVFDQVLTSAQIEAFIKDNIDANYTL